MSSARTIAFATLRAAEQEMEKVPEVLTVGAVVQIKNTLKATLLAMRCALERVDDVEI